MMRSAVGLAGLMLVCATGGAGAQVTPARSGAAIYRDACRQCHGVNGRGVPAAALGLPVQPRDLTDCQAGPREADADWLAIIRDGGPARAFHRSMPALGGALNDTELRLVLSYARTLCTNTAWPRGELNFPKALGTEKAFPEDEVLVTETVDLEGDGSAKTKAVYEKRFGPRNQIEVVVPVAAQPVDGSWTAGFGDMAFAFKRVLVASHARGSIVSITGELSLPTASATDGWGAGYAALESFVTAGQVLPGDGFVQFQGGVAFPHSPDAKREGFSRFVLGKTFMRASGREFSPMVELLGVKEFGDGQKMQWDVMPEMQVTLSTRKHIRTNVGLRIPLTDGAVRKTQLMFYLLWDWFDGRFFEGW
jgi:mono/diheme cytochrome c family protein